MNIYIKNMVCVRCKMAVESVLKELNIQYRVVELGKVNLVAESLSPAMQDRLGEALKHYELELMDNKKKILVESIKTSIIEMLNKSTLDSGLKFSVMLSSKLNYDYTYLSNSFSEMEGITIEKYFISTKVEKVKALLVYEAMSLKEIAYQLNYSSVAHLCLQFKKVTGITPGDFKKLSAKDNFTWLTSE